MQETLLIMRPTTLCSPELIRKAYHAATVQPIINRYYAPWPVYSSSTALWKWWVPWFGGVCVCHCWCNKTGRVAGRGDEQSWQWRNKTPTPPNPPRVYLIICEDQQCSRMRKGRDLAPRSTGEDGLIGSVTSPRTHPPLNTPESPPAH